MPAILDELAADRAEVLPLLRQQYLEENERLTLALLPVEPDLVRQPLVDWMLQTDDPAEVLLAREALALYREELATSDEKPLVDSLWSVMESRERDKESLRLRAAVALAKYDPESEKWVKVQDAVANDLLAVPTVYLCIWLDGFDAVRGKLYAPLSMVFRNSKRSDAERARATDILAHYAADEPRMLANLLLDADDKQFAVIYPKLKGSGEQGAALLSAEVVKKPEYFEEKTFFEATGTIAEDSAKVNTHLGSSPSKRFEFKFQAGKTYRLTMESHNVHSFLVLEDKAGKELAYGDDRDGGLNSMLEYTFTLDDSYSVFAASNKGSGLFALTIKEETSGDDRDTLAKRQANAAVALMRLGQPEKVWPLLKLSPDPTVRSYLIHRLSPLGASAATIVKRLDASAFALREITLIPLTRRYAAFGQQSEF